MTWFGYVLVLGYLWALVYGSYSAAKKRQPIAVLVTTVMPVLMISGVLFVGTGHGVL